MSYTSEDLAALPKIAAHLESLRKWMRESCTCPPTMAETHDCKWHLTALTLDDDRTALLKAHAEIVRLQAIEERAKRVQHNFRPWLDDPMRDVDNTLGTLLRYIIEEPESRLEGK